MDHVSDLMQLSKVTSTRTYTRDCYGRFMQPGPEAVDEDSAGSQRWISSKKRSNHLKYKEKKIETS